MRELLRSPALPSAIHLHLKEGVRNGPREFASILAICLNLVLQVSGAETRTAIGPGASREEVISAFGRPAGESKLGGKEILNYPLGQVVLENGRVLRIEFSKKGALPVPRPPAASAPAANPGDHWLTDFNAASREAGVRNVPILAMFTGPDGSVVSRMFLEQVATNPEFTKTFSADYVLLRIDFTTPTLPTGRAAESNDQLRARYGLADFPAVLFLTSKGERLAAVDFSKSPSEGLQRADAIAMLREVRAKLALGAEIPAPVSGNSKGAETTSPLQMDRLTPFALKVGLRSAQSLIASAAVIGSSIAFLIGWLLWRTRAKPIPYRGPVLAARISEAASGVPTLPEVLAWSKEQVCAMTAVLAESEGYEAEMLPGGDKDIVLTRRGDIQPSVVVCCSPGRAGTVTAKNVRDLLGTVTVDRVRSGWFVSPAGFSNDARAYAAQHKLLLIDGAHLMARIRDLPPILVPKLQTNRPG